jgi:sterol desaturase/sphingolipid hydroxylase (fatty acid hydroxylase superfamily)
MSEYKISNKGTTELFNNPVLEKLTRTHFAFPVTLYIVIGLFCVTFGYINDQYNLLTAILLYVGGVIFFSFVEYLIHRFLFHFHAETESQKQLKYKMHGVHHHFPKDKDRLVMPPVISVLLATMFFFIFHFTMGKYSLAFFGGFSSGYSIYLFIHYSVHRFRQPKNFLGILWKHHSLHHYRSEDAAFGVSMPLWDYVFKSMPEKKSIKKEEMESLPDYL